MLIELISGSGDIGSDFVAGFLNDLFELKWIHDSRRGGASASRPTNKDGSIAKHPPHEALFHLDRFDPINRKLGRALRYSAGFHHDALI